MEQLSRSPAGSQSTQKHGNTKKPDPKKHTNWLVADQAEKHFPPINFSCCSIYRILADTQAKHSHGFLYCKSHQFGQCPRKEMKKQKKIPTSYSQNQTETHETHTKLLFNLLQNYTLLSMCTSNSI